MDSCVQQISDKIKDGGVQERMGVEARVREGAYKLLTAATDRGQALGASKSVLTCDARVRACAAELREREERLEGRLSDSVSGGRVPCKARVALSGLRIPLMWKDSDHFSNKGSSRTVAVFCLIGIGAEIFDTEMVSVDKSVTDICFEASTIFSSAGPCFQLTLELYGCAADGDAPLTCTPKKLARKLRDSLGRASGRKRRPPVDDGDPESFLLSHPIPPVVRFSLLAHATLGLAQADGTFRSQSLTVVQNAESSSWLPLYGSICCRLAAQPDCMTQEMMTGFLDRQESVGGMLRSCPMYCILKAGTLACYYSPEEIRAKMEPALTVPINKDTRIRSLNRDRENGSNALSICNPVAVPAGANNGNVFVVPSGEELCAWLEAFRQHLHDQAKWQHCCSELMDIEAASPRKPPLFRDRRPDSFYEDLSIDSPGKFQGLTDIIHDKIQETGGRFLIGQRDEETAAPDWCALFTGSRPLVVQKTVLSPGGVKKRRAPPPPPDKQPYALPNGAPCGPLQEEQKLGEKPRPRTGRPSLDAKFSSIIQQLQRHHGSTRKPVPIRSRDSENQPPEGPLKPVPAPRHSRKSFQEKVAPKGW